MKGHQQEIDRICHALDPAVSETSRLGMERRFRASEWGFTEDQWDAAFDLLRKETRQQVGVVVLARAMVDGLVRAGLVSETARNEYVEHVTSHCLDKIWKDEGPDATEADRRFTRLFPVEGHIGDKIMDVIVEDAGNRRYLESGTKAP